MTDEQRQRNKRHCESVLAQLERTPTQQELADALKALAIPPQERQIELRLAA